MIELVGEGVEIIDELDGSVPNWFDCPMLSRKAMLAAIKRRGSLDGRSVNLFTTLERPPRSGLLDLYLSDTMEGFAPPAPFTLSEMDPSGLMPDRVYTKSELQSYLGHGRRKLRALVAGLTDERARERRVFGTIQGSVHEMLLYNLRHVQHHAAQLNLILRQVTDSAPGWVFHEKA